jgi:hypothetical protein
MFWGIQIKSFGDFLRKTKEKIILTKIYVEPISISKGAALERHRGFEQKSGRKPSSNAADMYISVPPPMYLQFQLVIIQLKPENSRNKQFRRFKLHTFLSSTMTSHAVSFDPARGVSLLCPAYLHVSPSGVVPDTRSAVWVLQW